jgi:DNA-directed RNA polymerase subunit omega
MIYPSIDKILNTVDSKYTLVHVIAKRAQQIQKTGHYQLPENEYKNKKELGRALEELDKGLIKYSN